MVDAVLEPRLVRMPELATGTWLNTIHPLGKQQFLGQVVLIDFWDYTCLNCLRTLPYLNIWHQRYANLGLKIVGIHSPEFGFAESAGAVEAAIAEHEIPYPVLLDNRYENWERFTNKAWPTKYLIDSGGYLRFRRQGEGFYRETESAIQQLLSERDPDVSLPELLPPLRPEDSPGAVCYRATPELFTGYQMGGLRGHALGNAGGYDQEGGTHYHLPMEQRMEGHFYLDGYWIALPESIASAEDFESSVILPYRGVTVNAVIGAASEPDEKLFGMLPESTTPEIEILQDNRSLTAANAGKDVVLRADGRSTVRVERARMVELVHNESFEAHELTLKSVSPSLQLYSFSFTSCVRGADPLVSDEIQSTGT